MRTPTSTSRALFTTDRIFARLSFSVFIFVALFLVAYGHAAAQAPTRVWPPNGEPLPIVEPNLPAQVASTADSSLLAPFASWTRIVFVSLRDGVADIYVANGDGTMVQRVTNSPAVESRPALHPEGSRIAFDADYDGDGVREIWMVNVDGSGLHQLVHAPGSNWAPAFSPDWTRVAYTSNRNGNNDIYMMELATGVERQVTSAETSEFDAVWMPGHDQIFYVRQVDEEIGALARSVWNASTSSFVEVGFHTSAAWGPYLTRPHFSPDGSFISMSHTGKDAGERYFYSLLEYRVDHAGEYIYLDRIIASSKYGTDYIGGGYLPATSLFSRIDMPLVTTYFWSIKPSGVRLLGAALSVATPQGNVPVAASGVDIAGNWVSTDHEGPLVDAPNAPTWIPHSSGNEYEVSAIDPAGVDAYLFATRQEDGDEWRPITLQQGILYMGDGQVRARARDFAGNLSAWTPVHIFKHYSHFIRGAVIDVRGYPMASVALGIGNHVSYDIHNLSTDSVGMYEQRISVAGTMQYLHPYLLGFGEFDYARLDGNGVDPQKIDPGIPNTWANLVLPLKGADIADGGFEPSETLSQTWTLQGGAYVGARYFITDYALVYDGEQSLGLPTTAASATFTATLPVEMHAPTLSLAWKASEPTAPASMVADITSSNGVTATIVLSPSTYVRDETWDWRHVWADLGPFLGETITVTLRSEHQSAGLIYVDAVHVSSWVTPVIKDVVPEEAAIAADADAAIPMLIVGENFAEPVKLYYGNGTQLRPLAVTFVDDHTLRFTPPANLAPGNYQLTLANRAGTNAEAYAAVSAGLRGGIQTMLPIVQWNK